MLTCKIGESVINCIDSPYDRYQFKKWSNKGILKCPVCNRDYEYCHGEVVPPYFRHKDKECSGYYTEPETEEHKKGKTLLYEWLKNQDGIDNLQLEAWLPETKQRPDIYFEQNGKRYVIEYQCTPIASEYIKRRELYKLNSITDIWVLGTEKYNIDVDEKGNPIHATRYKSIEKELNKIGIVYLDVKRKLITANAPIAIDEELDELIHNNYYSYVKYKFQLFTLYYKQNDFLFHEYLDNLLFNNGKFDFVSIIKGLIKCTKNHYLKEYERIEKENRERNLRIERMERKAKEMKEKLKEVESKSDYIGEIGKEIDLRLLLVEEIFFYVYGSSLYKFIDEHGNIFVWMTSTCTIDVGEYIELVGKVKEHSEYQGMKQTRLVRCKVKE